MIALWLAYALLLGALFGLAASLLERVLRFWRLPVRGVWAAALAATLAAPVLLVDRPEPVAVSAVTVGAAVVVDAPIPTRVPSVLERIARRADLVLVRARAALAPFDRPLLGVWVAGSLLMLGALLRSAVQLHRRRRAWEPRAVDGEEVLIAPDTGPAVVGSAAPKVVLPAWVLDLDPSLRRLVLRHETEHLRAGDPQLLLCGVAAVVLAPWNPALWWQLGRLRLAVELDCDRRVLRAHHDVERYGLLLMAVGQRTSGLLRLATPALSEPTTSLERRIAAMTARPPRRRAARAAGLAAAAALLVAVACMAPGPNMVVGPTDAAADAAPAPAVVDANATFLEFQVEQAAAQIPGRGAPKYPPSLREQGVTGQVIAQVVVDTTGRVDVRTFKVLESSHPLFSESVRNALAEARFRPAEVGGRKVKQLVQLPYTFNIGEPLRIDDTRDTANVHVQVLLPTRAPLRSDTAAGALRPTRAPTRASVVVDSVGSRTGGLVPVRRTPLRRDSMFEFTIEKPATLLPSSPAPAYPADLRGQGTVGTVRAMFVVNADGTVDAGSFKVVHSDHERFTAAVRAALPRLRYSPAQVEGRNVRQLVQTSFDFQP